MSKRTYFHVLPRGKHWGCKTSSHANGCPKAANWLVVSNVARLLDKETYVAAVKQLARTSWKMYGRLGEVVVHNRNGQIGAGKGSRTTFGKDPRKSKG